MGPSKTNDPATVSRLNAANNGFNEKSYHPAALHLLVAVEDAEVQEYCRQELPRNLHTIVSSAYTVTDAQALLVSTPVDVLLLDLDLSGGAGRTVLEDLWARQTDITAIVMTAHASMESAVEVMRLGAVDYLSKPLDIQALSAILERVAARRSFDGQSQAIREPVPTGNGIGMLIGRSPVMGKLYRILSKVASTTHPVLIFGEAGTGKELVARSIHANGPNAAKPFIPIDCGSLVPSLVERELFGYVKGAFPEATQANIGLLAAADGGTVFLDEIAELPLSLQARLLRTLQEKQVRPIGGTQSTPISVRVLASTNRDLAAMVQNGRFRKDLFYRLNVVNICIPPLRDRKSDILLLAESALERLRSESAVSFTLTHDAIRHLTEYEWPGNVRELEHALERACALSSGPVLRTVDFPASIQSSLPATNASYDASRDTVPQPHSQEVISIAELEKQAILHTIDQFNGDKLTAARLLGIGKTTLYRKLKEYGLETRNGSAQELDSSTSDEN